MLDIRIIRKVLSWNFAFLSLLCIALGFRIFSRTLHLLLKAAFPHPWAPLLYAVFPAMAAVFGIAWWKVWKQRPSERAWGIAASILMAMYPLWHIIHSPRSIRTYAIITLAVGIVGVIAFAMREGALAEADDPHPNDGLL